MVSLGMNFKVSKAFTLKKTPQELHKRCYVKKGSKNHLMFENNKILTKK